MKHRRSLLISAVSLSVFLLLNIYYRYSGWYTPAAADSRYVYVKGVIDGDTIAVSGGEKVRYLGIDTPEAGEPFYEEARQRNSELVLGKRVKLEICGSVERDRYGRLLAWVYADGTFVNETLLREGLARRLIIPPCGLEKAKELEKVEKEAVDKKLGLWGGDWAPAVKAPVIRPHEAASHAGETVRVRGRAIDVHKSRKAIFINFSPDRRRGFAAVIFERSFMDFIAAGIDPVKFKGKVITITGTVTMYGERPEIIVKHPWQIKAD